MPNISSLLRIPIKKILDFTVTTKQLIKGYSGFVEVRNSRLLPQIPINLVNIHIKIHTKASLRVN